MFGFSMIQMIRQHANKLDRPLRDQLMNVYKPFRWTPCFMHKSLESYIKLTKRFKVVVEFNNKECHSLGMNSVYHIAGKHIMSKLKNEYRSISCCSAVLTPNAIENLLVSSPHIKMIHLDREVKALLDVATPTTKAVNLMKDDTVLTGKGINIAVIDTGIHPHQDLEGRIKDFKDFVNNIEEAYDDNGHGTHCAGDAVGNGFLSGGLYVAPAPNAKVIGVKVLDKMGSGSLSTVMDGVQWCIDYNKDKPYEEKIHIISMSLGASAQLYYDENQQPCENCDPMVSIVEAAWDSGIVVCVAAGNEGDSPKTIASPGISDRVITVGAMDDRNTIEPRTDDGIAAFSSRGKTIYGIDKPDIVAPGVNIISLRAPNSYLDKFQKSNRVDSNYFILSGTSMATPICAGVVALILEANKGIAPDVLKQKLMTGADPWGVNPGSEMNRNTFGAGYINAERSV
ncbi:S8 family peptidase [Peribacillus acanthi]|uniref:S8 family peptidase n=1 Tax=Peribacillus acanthi TaxID=2171554 RepID=UPI000D3E326C|nr:S8 family peptidase [Peribacillus acanthi]